MRDIWAFLLQTLTASGAAVLLLVVKAMFRDKLSPRWQFAVWGVLGLVLLIPAGFGGRYVLLNWPLWVEFLKTLLAGEYTLTQVTLPVPMPSLTAPETLWDWLFLAYLAGVAVFLMRYLIAYLRLWLALHRGTFVNETTAQRIRMVAETYSLPVCPAVEVPGLHSAFICGVFSPVLVLPAGTETDDKVLLHELLHLKHHDAAWGLVICLLRCIHWCNPLLWHCANQAGNDLEARCDQRVLEYLEGEERREYGRILLSMANEKYARAPGTTSMANGGKNIRRRIESIARFKKYPAGMALVSVCVAIVLAGPLLFGTQASSVYNEAGRMPTDRADVDLSLASARTVWCTTPAGAMDTYAKSLMEQSGPYRAMCAPMDMQAEIAAEMLAREEANLFPTWEAGLPSWPDQGQQAEGYYVYNLEYEGENTYVALVVIPVNPVDGQREENRMYLALQNVRVEKEESRWVVIPQEEIRYLETMEESLRWGCRALPTYTYSGTAENFRVEVHHQKSFVVDNTITEENDMSWLYGSTTRFDSIPKPNAEFGMVYWTNWSTCHYLGDENEKGEIRSIGLTTYPLMEGEERPELRNPGYNESGGSSSGEDWSSKTLMPDWGNEILLGGGGTGQSYNGEDEVLPACYAADLHINGKRTEMTLLPEEGGAK